MKRVLKKVTAALLAATMVVGLAACGGSGSGSSDKSASKSDKIKIGVSIWSSTDVLGSQCKKMLDAAGFPDAVISASNDLDEYLIDSLKVQGATINSWGVGTNLITAKDCPSFGGVYKLAAVKDKTTGEFIPKIKLSENAEKITNPGNKTIYRIYDKENGKIIADLICLVGEKFDTNNSLLLFDPQETWKKTLLAPGSYTMRELLVPVFLNGECVYESPKVMDIQKYCKEELDTLWDESKRLVNPHTVHVDLSNELWQTKQKLLDSYHKK